MPGRPYSKCALGKSKELGSEEGENLEANFLSGYEQRKELEFSPYYFRWEIFRMVAQSQAGISAK
jgi:hypothetical protein